MKNNYFDKFFAAFAVCFALVSTSVQAQTPLKIEAESFLSAKSSVDADGDGVGDGDAPVIESADGVTYVTGLKNNMLLVYSVTVTNPAGVSVKPEFKYQPISTSTWTNFRFNINTVVLPANQETGEGIYQVKGAKGVDPLPNDWTTLEGSSFKLPAGTHELAVKINRSNGSNFDYFTLTFTDLTTDVDVAEVAGGITASPNPSASGIFQLSDYAAYTVYNMVGALIESGDDNKVDLSSYPDGIYMLNVNGKVIKLVK